MSILSGLSKKNKIEPVILSVERLISELLKQNIKKQSDKSLSPELEVLKFDKFQINFLEKPDGFVLRFFMGSIRTPLLIFFPDDFISKYVSLKNRKDPESELLTLFSFIPEYLLTKIEDGTEFTHNSEEKLVSSFHIGAILKSKDEFFWSISGCEIVQIRIGSVSCYLFLEEKKFLMFNKNCQDYEVSINNIFNPVVDYPSLKKLNNRLELTGSHSDFLFGIFFLPRSLLLGEHRAVNGFNSVIFKPEFEYNENGVSFTLNLTIEGNIFDINYFIPSKIESRGDLTKIIQTLVKAVLPVWRKYFDIDKVGSSRSLPETTQVECLLTGGIKYKNSLIPVEIGLSEGIINLLAGKLVELNVNYSTDLARVMLINQSLLHIFLKENLFLPLNLSEFLNLIDEIDLRRITQNFFSGTGWKGNVMQSLFSYSIKDIQKKKIYYFQDTFFDREGFFKYLPNSQKDEWNQSRSASVSYKEMVLSGRDALHDIFQTFRNDHLELSYKGATLLKNEFKVKGDKKIRVELDQVIEKESFSYLLEDTFPRDVQNLLAKLTAKVLANALVLYTESLVSLEPFMSRNYKSELKDLIKIIQRNSIKDGFDMEEIRKDFFELHTGLKNLSKEELI